MTLGAQVLTSSKLARRVLSSSFVKAATTPHGIDRYIEMIDPLWSGTEIRAEVTDVARKTADSVTLTLRPNSNWTGFRAGQFVRLSVEIDGVRRTRCYSPACSEFRRDGRIELTIKVDPNGLVSRHLQAQAAPGMIVQISPAQGEFVLPLPHPRRILLISGGSGVTPVMSMLRTLTDKAFNGKITFLHYSFTEDDIIYRRELEEIKAKYESINIVHAYTEQKDGGDLHGYFSKEHLLAADRHYAEAETFLCGPLPLMDAVRAVYEDEGLTDQLHLEQFTAPVRTVSSEDAAGELVFSATGTTVANSGRTILEQAEDAGLTPEYGCRMGICFSCVRRKDSGTTRNVLTGDVCSDGDTSVKLCVSEPVGDVSIDL
ncbi:ferredoxin reductase [Hoyosella subflava]|uniref:Oxidoreductase n=1 Tax=Hoyosella subflava (strain DSM 45089 / JCM 17490 / NBRC 109087 / DQS3-9A1) TaxID=443218 RepID=F6EM65_HOYSD|nr:ferredoxin reductase [Hoyosella subflava]AEF39271.1 Oxidoreductase [Hoyosella subflava DQS3-9A1]